MNWQPFRISKIPSLLYVLVGVLLPVLYIVFLLFYNYQDNIALQQASIKKFKLNIESQAETLSYFFLERKYDIYVKPAPLRS